jgi:hypothetical protein
VGQSFVVVASMLQYLLAATFLIAAIVAVRHGTRAQRAAEANVAEQGFAKTILAEHKVQFEESIVAALFPIGISLALATLATLNLAGVDAGRILSWIIQPIVLIGGGGVTASQVWPERYIRAAFRKSGDALTGIDVEAFVDAARQAFPSWLRTLIATRFMLATVGSVLVIVLLAVPSANVYFV